MLLAFDAEQCWCYGGNGTAATAEVGSFMCRSVMNTVTIVPYMETDQQFVDYVVRALVNNPDKVNTNRTVDEMGVLITVKVDPTDMGYLIGRQGQTARAVRTLLKVVGAKNNARVNLKIEEPEGSTRGPRKSAPAAPSTTDDVSDVDLNLDL
ncbi:MAG: KH domain-containing protein [bacterium]|nr:KH domain-containing protein [bacterium]